jgi:hypothetical protein
VNEDELGSEEFVALIESATALARQPLESTDGGLDEPTRTAARSFLRRMFDLFGYFDGDPDAEDGKEAGDIALPETYPGS